MSTTAAPALTVIEATGEDAAAIQSTVDAFRSALGDLNANEPVNNVGGRRQINWDAAPDAISDPNAFPGDFFNANVAPRARGIEFQATGDTTGFLLSSTEASGQPTAFGFPNDFPVFSEERLFSPVGGTTFDVLFFDPANPDQQATTTGLGVVFSGLDFDDTVSMSFFDIDGNLLAEEFASAPESAVGLSFLGVVFDSPVVASVSIAGGGRFLAGNGEFDGPEGDAFVMDDFIFGEPTPVSPVPLPAGAPMLVAALALAGMITRRRA
ncbi:MAG: VPLPA-CTERM sorting domain-containing protein [Pseudomonadota bacterium]